MFEYNKILSRSASSILRQRICRGVHRNTSGFDTTKILQGQMETVSNNQKRQTPSRHTTSK